MIPRLKEAVDPIIKDTGLTILEKAHKLKQVSPHIMTGEVVADLLGISHGYLNNILSGRNQDKEHIIVTRKAARVFLFPNGMVSVMDKHKNRIPQMEGNITYKLFAMIKHNSQKNVKWFGVDENALKKYPYLIKLW